MRRLFRANLLIAFVLLTSAVPAAAQSSSLWDQVSATVLSQQLYGSSLTGDGLASENPPQGLTLAQLFASSQRFSGRYALGIRQPAEQPSALATAAAKRSVEILSNLYGDHPLLRAPQATPVAH